MSSVIAHSGKRTVKNMPSMSHDILPNSHYQWQTALVSAHTITNYHSLYALFILFRIYSEVCSRSE